MQRSLGLAAVGRVSAARRRVVGATQLHHLAGRIFDDAGAGDEVRGTQPNSRPGARRKNFAGGSSIKSSRSIQSSRLNGTLRVPADGSSGLLTTSISSTWSSG